MHHLRTAGCEQRVGVSIQRGHGTAGSNQASPPGSPTRSLCCSKADRAAHQPSTCAARALPAPAITSYGFRPAPRQPPGTCRMAGDVRVVMPSYGIRLSRLTVTYFRSAAVRITLAALHVASRRSIVPRSVAVVVG
jgi:hypothetical protein